MYFLYFYNKKNVGFSLDIVQNFIIEFLEKCLLDKKIFLILFEMMILVLLLCLVEFCLLLLLLSLIF